MQYSSTYDPVRANSGKWIGTVATDVEFSHSTKKGNLVTNFLKFTLQIERKSGITDDIMVIFQEGAFANIEKGDVLYIKGSFRSFNLVENQNDKKSKLILYIHPKFITHVHDIENFKEMNNITDPNAIQIDGYVCKKTEVRTTPTGRAITDIIVAVNRPNKKSDYIPVIIWDDNAKKYADMEIGTRVKIKGRAQSRVYKKRMDDGTTEDRVAYEISAGRIYFQDAENPNEMPVKE